MKMIKVLSAGLLVGGVIMSMAPALAATTMTPPMTTTMAASGFSDVSPSSQYYNAVMDLQARGIISGYPDGTFRPDQVVNRAEALKLILGAAKIEIPTDAAMGLAGFMDVDGSAWYAPYLRKALSMGVVEGYPDATFRPAQTVNLVENLKILIKTEGIDLSDIPAMANPYSDSEANAWYSTYLEYANEKNLIDADANGDIHPDQGMTRGKLARLLYRLLFIQDRKLDSFPKGVMIKDFSNEPVSFSTTGLDVSVFKDSSGDVSNAYNATELAAAAEECGSVHPAGYFDTLMTKMSGKLTTYTFVENKPAQENMYVVTVMPNNFGYTDEKSFENDFNVCAAGASSPIAENASWLMFDGSCGGAVDDSGLPQGCGDISAVVEPSLKLK